MPPTNLDRLTREYGPTTWDVYDRLDHTLEPRRPDSLHELARVYLRPGAVILDAGCRDAEHLIKLVQDNDAVGVGVDPVAIHIERARAAVEDAELTDRIVLHHGVMHDLPHPDGHFDFVWCRDVVEQVDDLAGALRELVRATKSDARMVVYTVFATELLDERDDAMLRRHLGFVDGNLDRARVEAAFERSGFEIELVDEVSTEWREYAEERTQPASRALLRLARLRRQRDHIVREHGQDIFDHVEANLHWEVFQLLGKLSPIVYVLRRP
jgi:SAM-dependent methyltransferase